ncbi:scaffolding protein [Mycobacterium phage Deby]|uniref:Scaffolding protein n=3 Tax=Anayavirus angelica TaxID=861044 RepID=A0A2D2W3J2_9CAUD|nr:head scaffolding protein [Mycobacterium phage Angelica]ADL71101.1 scaffolding protein [Mycobacterium phage Angelica]ATS92760.1 scaffolding protein [Mycobacterium phage Sulley]AVO24768.1 scaffolding protein [Mycobacterium phage Deby]
MDPENEGNEAPEGTEPTDGGAPPADDAPKADAPKTFTQAEVDAMIAPLQTAAQELQTIKDGEKTELQKALDRAAAAEARAETVEFERLRDKVANREGKRVPVASLVGKTEAELIASADALIAWRDENAPKPPEPKQQKRNPAGSGGGFKSGATGADGGSTDAKVKAVEALRRLRSGK